MPTSEMMNVVVLSCGRNKRWKRHSIAVFDQIRNIKEEENHNEKNPLHELMSKSMHQAAERKAPENNRDIYVVRRLVKSSDGITASDLELLRKTFMERFAACKEHSEKIYELKSAICTINEIKTFPRDPQWLTQYQYILNWCYGQIRFLSDPAERRRLFPEVKEKYRKMFKLLSFADDIDKLSSYLHWSQLCYQYAELVDEESLSWCIEAVASARSELSASSSRSSTLSRQTDSSGSHGSPQSDGGGKNSGNSNSNSTGHADQIEPAKAENRRRRKIATIELIRSNILKIENVHACSDMQRLKAVL